ncbi:MAG: class I SAM-dependent methyltransferase [Christensenellaceae bacterium]|nr:class I SAM-dependent methyltransferase [Christensenellaceae bacterium]
MKGTAAFYDATAHEWAASGYSDEGEVHALLAFARQYPAGSRFLDLCCGCGCDSARIHALGYDVVGIDFSEESLRIAREKNPDVTFYQDNLLNDYSYIGQVDAAYVIAGLVHIETAQLRQAFVRIRSVLKAGGGLFVMIREGHGKMLDRSIKVVNGETYDRNFIGHTLEELIETSLGLFTFVKEVECGDPGWHNYIFQTA